MIIALISLAASAFLSSTILPGSSEAVFTAFIIYYPDYTIAAIITATAANTAGSLTSFLITYFIPHKKPSGKALDLIKRYGTPVLFFSFAPIAGDLLPLAAGWLKLSVWKSALFIMLGKFVRYLAVGWIAAQI